MTCQFGIRPKRILAAWQVGLTVAYSGASVLMPRILPGRLRREPLLPPRPS